jgi:predicted regulator of Ras-like GTPase activity (Roadblock/LC7/MglB family)
MMSQLSTDAQNVNWMLSSFVEKTPGVDQAIAVSSDGLLMAISSNMDRATADKLSAAVTGMRSLSDGAARVLAKGGLNQVICEMAEAYLFVSAISGGSTVGVVANRGCDLGLVGYEITLLVARVGSQLTPELIAELKYSLVTL